MTLRYSEMTNQGGILTAMEKPKRSWLGRRGHLSLGPFPWNLHPAGLSGAGEDLGSSRGIKRRSPSLQVSVGEESMGDGGCTPRALPRPEAEEEELPAKQL